MPQKILVTGAGGFIGSHLCEALVRRGHSVRAFVHYNSLGTWGWLDRSPEKAQIEVVAGDIRDFDSVSRAVEGVDGIYHLAALIGIPYSYVSPLAYVRTNVEGTYNVVESARRCGTPRVVVTSTSEVYGTAKYVPINEAHPHQPQSPYSASKIGADSIALSYHMSFELPLTVVRPFNTYGPRQSARAIIPTVITQLLAGKTTLQLGNLDPQRDLTFVEDTVDGMIQVFESKALVGQSVNIGVGETISIRDLIEKIFTIVGTRADLTESQERVRPAASEVMRLLSDNSYLRSTTGWAPKHTLDQGLERTVAWLRDNLALYRPDTYSV